MSTRTDGVVPGRAAHAAGAGPSFALQLAERASTPGIRKGARTRLRLMAATARLLQEEHAHHLRVTDISIEAGVSQGTFYLYFTDKVDAITATLMDFVQFLFDCLESAAAAADSFDESVYATTLAYVDAFERNRGLFRAMMQLTEESEQIGRVYQALNRHWNYRTARAIARRRGVEGEPEARDLLHAFALGGMTDDFLANLYNRRDPVLTECVESPEHAARLLTELWLATLRSPGM